MPAQVGPGHLLSTPESTRAHHGTDTPTNKPKSKGEAIKKGNRRVVRGPGSCTTQTGLSVMVAGRRVKWVWIQLILAELS